jgi:hypothetical protein
MTMNEKIAGRIIVLMTNHMQATGADMGDSLVWAFNRVLGPGAYQAFAGDLYDMLRAKAAA